MSVLLTVWILVLSTKHSSLNSFKMTERSMWLSVDYLNFLSLFPQLLKKGIITIPTSKVIVRLK